MTKWPDGPRFRVTEIRGYQLDVGAGSQHQSSSYMVVDDAYRCVIRTFREVPGRTRKMAEGLALYICAALNANATSYVGGLSVDMLWKRIRAGYAPDWQSPRIPKDRRPPRTGNTSPGTETLEIAGK